jgi:ATP-dependent Clp protease adaptor protein ClpS
MGEGPLRVKSCRGKAPFFCMKGGSSGSAIACRLYVCRRADGVVASCSQSVDPGGYRRAIVLLEWLVAVRYKPVISEKLFSLLSSTVPPMSDNDIVQKPKTKTKPKVERPKLYKIILVNDDYTPREFVIMVLQAVFRISEETGYRVMMTAHKLGSCVVMVCARDIAETKAQEAIDLAKSADFPLMFTTEPEE